MDGKPIATDDDQATLVVRRVVKRFGSFRALDEVDFDLRSGEVHILFGENGAGKSTLINVVSGSLRPDEGTIQLQGRKLELSSVLDARANGIATVFQEFSLAPSLSVEENLLLGSEPKLGPFINKSERKRRALAAISRLDFSLDLDALVETLSRGEQQMVEIAKAVLVNPKVLILDEPTASLTDGEVDNLFRTVRQLRQAGVAIIYITHRMSEIAAIGDRVTVMRDGRRVATLTTVEADHQRLVELMTGRPVGAFYPQFSQSPGDLVFSSHDLTAGDGSFRKVSIAAHAGEIVGIAGLVGCGKSEIGQAAFGLVETTGGELIFQGEPVRPRPSTMLRKGLCYIPSDRRKDGLFLGLSLRENIAIQLLPQGRLSKRGFLNRGSERLATARIARQVNVRPLDTERPVGDYSGGNQQKVVFARAATSDFRMLILDEPTVGVDVESKREIYALLADLVQAGAAIILISSDMDEIRNLCNRVYVVSRGEIAVHLQGTQINEANILAGYFGQAGGVNA